MKKESYVKCPKQNFFVGMKNIENKNHKTKTKTKTKTRKDNNKVPACFGYKQFPSFNSFRL